MYQRRLVGLLLSGAAVILILASVFTRTWWSSSDPEREVAIGLRNAEVCEKKPARSFDDEAARPPDDYGSSSSYDDRPKRRGRSDCTEQGLRGYLEDEQDRADDRARYDDDAPEAAAIPGAFIRLGAVAFAFGIIAALGVCVAVGVILFPRAPRHRQLGTVVALACGAFAGVALAYVVSAPSGFGEGVRAGPGVALALLGAGAGVAGALILQRIDTANEPTTRALTEATRLATISRAPVLIAGGLGVLLIAGALFTNTWFHGEHGDASMGVGLREVENCDRQRSSYDDGDRGREKCVTATIPARYDGAEQPTKLKVFLSAGNLAWLLGLAAIAIAVACGGLAALRQPVDGKFAAWRIQIGIAAAFAVAAIVYTASRPAEVSDVGISFGPVLAVGGAGCLIGGAIMLGRWVTAMQVGLSQVPAHIANEISTPVAMPIPYATGYSPPPGLPHGYGTPPGYGMPQGYGPQGYGPQGYGPHGYGMPQGYGVPPGYGMPQAIPQVYAMPATVPSPFATPAPIVASPFAPSGAAPTSPFAPPTSPSPFSAAPPAAAVSPFAPPHAVPAAPPSPYAPQGAVPVPVAAPAVPSASGASPFPLNYGTPAPMASIPSCPTCMTPMLWVSAKSSWMCTVCRGRS